MKPKVLIVDDSEDIRLLVKKALSDIYIIETADGHDNAITKAYEFRPDIFILDIMLGESSGYELCSKLKSQEEFKSVPVIFLSSKTGSNSRITGYKLGAINFLEKPFENEELREILNTTLNSIKLNETNDQLNNKEITLNIASQEVLISGNSVHFTSSEFKILHLLLKNNNIVLSREKILNYISPSNLQASDRMIDTYISAIRKKIQKTSFSIKSVYSEGYKIINTWVNNNIY